jgi:hypothetical protein
MIGTKSTPRNLVIALAGAVACLSVPAVARAQNAPAVEKLIQMNKKALDDYETLEWDSAKRTLLQALVFGKKSNLETHPMMARTYVHLGAVYIVGFNDKQKGLQSFQRALEIDPTIRIAKAMSTPELEDVFSQASRGAGGGAGADRAAEPPPDRGGSEAEPPPPSPSSSGGRRRRAPIMEAEPPPPKPVEEEDSEPDLPARINVLECPTKDETPPEKSVLIRCALAPNLPVTKLFLLYLEPGNDDFTPLQMEKTPKGWYAAKIPKKAVTGTSLRFYVEGRNDKGKAIVSNGRVDSPNVMLIREKEAAETEKELGGGRRRKEENPLDEPDPTRPRSFLGRIDKSKIGLDTRYGNRQWWFGFSIGSGYGFAPAGGLEALHELQSRYVSGIAWEGGAHLAPEIGYQLGPNFAISLEGRNQYIPQTSHFSQYAATGAQAVLLKLYMYTRQSRGRFFANIAAGGGEGFRLIASPAQGCNAPGITNGVPCQNYFMDKGGGPIVDKDFPNFKDTVRGGPGLAGVGGGFLYEISKSVSWVAEVNVLAGLPHFAAIADLNTGFQFNFGSTAPPPEDPLKNLFSKPKAKSTEAEPKRPKPKRPAQVQDDE